MRRLSLVGTAAVVAALLLAVPVRAEAPIRSDVVMISNTSIVTGTSQLDREKSGISFSLRTSGLTRGSANTIWVVIFDNPEFCSGGCDAADLGNPAVNGRAVWGAGTVSDNGTSAFDGHIPAGPYDADLLARGGGGAGTAFMDPLTAEVHLVVRTHGAAMQGMVADQIHSFGLGCNPTYANIQVAAYLAP